ncbi:MAG TPA: DEAD/DEAH box helicase [Blastocatellia bacterium]|nr:DEAD/DEAH box helicase [Blastocatellia bacterium]
MFLVRRFFSQFRESDRNLGRMLFARHGVQVHLVTNVLVRATVKSNEYYKVAIERTGDSLTVHCSCAWFEKGHCAHIWGAFLAADAKGFLRGVSDAGLTLVLGERIGGHWPAPVQTIGDESSGGNSGAPGLSASQISNQKAMTLKTPGADTTAAPVPKPEPKPPRWKRQLTGLTEASARAAKTGRVIPDKRQLCYIIDPLNAPDGSAITIEIGRRTMKTNGEWGKVSMYGYSELRSNEVTNPRDLEILSLMSGAASSPYGFYHAQPWRSQYLLRSPLLQIALPTICATGRCFLRPEKRIGQPADQLDPLEWDDTENWRFRVRIEHDSRKRAYLIQGWLENGEAGRPVTEPTMVVRGGLAFWGGRVTRMDDGDAFEWITYFRKTPKILVPANQRSTLLKELMESPIAPPLDMPDDMVIVEALGSPNPRLKVLEPDRDAWPPSTDLRAEVSFDYQGQEIPSDSERRGALISDENKLVVRNHSQERQFGERLLRAGFRTPKPSEYAGSAERPLLLLNPKKLPRVVAELLSEGWRVEAEGKLHRSASNFNIEVISGVDWFDLDARVDFGGVSAGLPELLAALKRGQKTLLLGDGTFGVLPEKWLRNYGLLAAMGSANNGKVRFGRRQIGVLDALLASQPDVSFDQTFAAARAELDRFRGVQPVDPPPGFTGDLRPYQREGLGWMHFLQGFGFGGCLADCMGLGKTVMALALLESRRELRSKHQAGLQNPLDNGANRGATTSTGSPAAPASLLVVPKSLVFNWKREAEGFTPDLRILDHTGMARIKGSEHFSDYDLVITTYGTLRRDAADFCEYEFDYVILDEAQAIKNASTESAQAVRLLRGGHRLALSGTPVENHLGELWSLFEFLNPGLLGSASVFKFFGGANPSDESRTLLARALRPFILRRTKQQVAADLPEKLEQTIFCEMEPAQRKLYDELRAHYRASLLGLIEQEGIEKSKIKILEALLRLRQAACHPGLIDKGRMADPSAKLDMLTSQLYELMDEGHKVLVFSQFTSFLAIVRTALDREGVQYEYLDGQTRDRQTPVERFQQDPDCKLFLISLKAGGLGLNLTSAEYVFLLDPWWNPAVEAQAIDRAHRIGQTRRVFAYRLISRDTVEEKVLELQKTKRNLADSIINADNSLIRELSRDDLNLLFS